MYDLPEQENGRVYTIDETVIMGITATVHDADDQECVSPPIKPLGAISRKASLSETRKFPASSERRCLRGQWPTRRQCGLGW